MSAMNDVERTQLVQETLQTLLEFILSQKFADVPGWMNEDLTVSQLRALFQLAYRGPLTVSQLAHLLELGKPATSTLVQQLVEHNLARRRGDTQDRRRSIIELTPQGSELVYERSDRRESHMRGWLCQMSDADLVGLHDGFQALLQTIKNGENDSRTLRSS